MSVSYAYEKLMIAVMTLATNRAEIKSRLQDAFISSLIHIRPDDLPEGELRDKLKTIKDDMTWTPAQGDEGTVAATVRGMLDEDAQKIAERIVSLFLDVRRVDPIENGRA